MLYAQVVFNIAVPRAFTYHVPDLFAAVVQPGSLVLAPFGKRELTGVVVACTDKTDLSHCKDIIDITEDAPLVSPALLELTRWIAEYYHCSWGQAVQLALPRGLEQKSVVKIRPVYPVPPQITELSDSQRHLYDMIFRQPDREAKYYRQKFGTGSFYHGLRLLLAKGVIAAEHALSEARVARSYERFVSVPANIPDNFSGLRGRDDLLALLRSLAGTEFRFDAFRERSGLSDSRIKTLAERGVIRIFSREKTRTPQIVYQEEKRAISLNDDQQEALRQIGQSLEQGKFGVFMLHGVTGSGKTQIYIEAIRKALALGRTALVMIPEIGLTPQTVRRFENEFPGKVAVFHSRLSLGERYDTWRQVQAGAFDIVIGPRSALFLPLKAAGVYVIDEEHDTSYKQSDPAPRYHARDVAVYLAKKQAAVVILGSATPSVESYYNALTQKFQLIELDSRINQIPMPEVTVIDMRREGRRPGGLNIISPYLEARIGAALENKEQVIILQNRRGFATFMQCRDCGFVPECAGCAISFTYHAYNNTLQCHYCGREQPAEKVCIRCGGAEIRYKGAGTEKIEKELKILFPAAGILRMDMDTTGRKGAHDVLLQKFKSHQADILLGTQMIAKGLDFENVTVVGVIAAEVGAALPDFRASERVFQLLTQVAGRAGRGDKGGSVVIQSFSDAYPAVQYARNHDFRGFYRYEIERRKKLFYPPFSRLILIRVSGVQFAEALRTARQIVHRLRVGARRLFQILGPAPAPFMRLKNMYRLQIILKTDTQLDRTGTKSKKIINDLLGSYLQNTQGAIRVVVDVDPLDML